MGFFDKNASFSDGTDYEIAEAGTYTCSLLELTTEQRPDYEDKTILKAAFKFVFETVEAQDSEGYPYKFLRFTGTSYGNDNANLTQLLDGMLGKRLAADEFGELELSTLMATKYRVTVTEHTTQAGKIVNKIVQVKPVAARAAAQKPGARPAPTAVNEEDEITGGLDDPFDEQGEEAAAAAAMPVRAAARPRR